MVYNLVTALPATVFRAAADARTTRRIVRFIQFFQRLFASTFKLWTSLRSSARICVCRDPCHIAIDDLATMLYAANL